MTQPPPAPPATGALAAGTAQGRWVLAAAVLGSGMAFLDGTVVNIALRDVGRDLDASLAQLQWVVDGYLLTLAALILLGGALGDRYGRRRVFMLGVAAFAASSTLCALAPDPTTLVGARAVQGVAAALLTPGSLALLQSCFRPSDRAHVIGQWTGLAGIAMAIGPLVGGTLVESVGWRAIFWINVPLGALVLWICWRHVSESSSVHGGRHFDVGGALLATLTLAAATVALVEYRALGAWTWLPAALAVGGGAAFLLRERSLGDDAMVPLRLFGSRVFSVTNTMTVLVYGALGAMTFFLVLQLQVVVGYRPLWAGLATLPITLVMLAGSSRSGALAARLGPRPQLSLGPVLCGLGCVLLSRVDAGTSYLSGILPGVLLFALGLVAMVAPLTSSVLAAAPDEYAGTASGINNAAARTGGLLAVAALPGLVGVVGDDYQQPAVFDAGFERALLACAVLLVVGGVTCLLGLRRTGPGDCPDLSPSTGGPRVAEGASGPR